MALTMADKADVKKHKDPWPADIAADFVREAKNPNPCVGTTLLSENERTRVWIIRLAPGERTGFHRRSDRRGARRGVFQCTGGSLPRRRAHRGDYLMHQHLQPECNAGRGAFGEEGC